MQAYSRGEVAVCRSNFSCLLITRAPITICEMDYCANICLFGSLQGVSLKFHDFLAVPPCMSITPRNVDIVMSTNGSHISSLVSHSMSSSFILLNQVNLLSIDVVSSFHFKCSLSSPSGYCPLIGLLRPGRISEIMPRLCVSCHSYIHQLHMGPSAVDNEFRCSGIQHCSRDMECQRFFPPNFGRCSSDS
jgi:hypothetical protein